MCEVHVDHHKGIFQGKICNIQRQNYVLSIHCLCEYDKTFLRMQKPCIPHIHMVCPTFDPHVGLKQLFCLHCGCNTDATLQPSCCKTVEDFTQNTIFTFKNQENTTHSGRYMDNKMHPIHWLFTIADI